MKRDIFSKENIEKAIHMIGFLVFVSYILGFVIWNRFLSPYGFFEYSFLQTRYLSAGMLSLCFFVSFSLPILPLVWIIFRNSRIILETIIITAFIFDLLLIFIIAPYAGIFTTLSPAIGGGRPTVISLLGSTKQIEYLGEFGIPTIPNGKNKLPVQTNFLCGLYENNDYFIVGIPGFQNEKVIAGRVMVIKKDEVIGFQPFPRLSFESGTTASSSLSAFRRVICDPFVGHTDFTDLVKSWFVKLL